MNQTLIEIIAGRKMRILHCAVCKKPIAVIENQFGIGFVQCLDCKGEQE